MTATAVLKMSLTKIQLKIGLAFHSFTLCGVTVNFFVHTDGNIKILSFMLPENYFKRKDSLEISLVFFLLNLFYLGGRSRNPIK